MKKILSFFSLLILAASISAQTIPNGDFENWTAGSPDSWATYNDLAALIGINPAPVTQESPAPSGTHLSVRNRMFQLNTSNLDTGNYLVRISNSNLIICKTLIKQ